MPRPGNEAQRGCEGESASALRADQSARDMEALLRQEVVEIVAGDAARDVGIAPPDLIAVAVAQGAERAIDLGAPAAAAHDEIERLVRGRADAQAQPVIGENLQLLDIVDGLAAEHGMDAQELLPILPPIVQYLCVAGSGAKVSP